MKRENASKNKKFAQAIDVAFAAPAAGGPKSHFKNHPFPVTLAIVTNFRSGWNRHNNVVPRAGLQLHGIIEKILELSPNLAFRIER